MNLYTIHKSINIFLFKHYKKKLFSKIFLQKLNYPIFHSRKHVIEHRFQRRCSTSFYHKNDRIWSRHGDEGRQVVTQTQGAASVTVWTAMMEAGVSLFFYMIRKVKLNQENYSNEILDDFTGVESTSRSIFGLFSRTQPCLVKIKRRRRSCQPTRHTWFSKSSCQPNLAISIHWTLGFALFLKAWFHRHFTKVWRLRKERVKTSVFSWWSTPKTNILHCNFDNISLVFILLYYICFTQKFYFISLI